MKITGHCVVKNEDRWIWFALQAVLPFLEKIYIYDTGSEDSTVEVIKSINSSKIIFEKKGKVDSEKLVKLRQEQIDKTDTDWFLLIDGDEIWPENQIKKLISNVESAPNNISAAFNKVRNCIGDIYHYLPESAGNYQIKGIKGNLNTRLIKKTKDLKVTGTYPLEVYSNTDGPLQAQDENILFCDCWYLHTTFLNRSTLNISKVSGSFGRQRVWEKGLKIAKNDLPEVLFLKFPNMIENPLKARGMMYEINASLTTPFLKIKRSIKK